MKKIFLTLFLIFFVISSSYAASSSSGSTQGTLKAGEISISPLTLTRPTNINFSASLRLDIPALDKTLAIRVPLGD